MKGITEISGQSSTGKTQFVLQALLQAILPQEHGGLGGSGLYLCTEDVPTTRWNQLVTAYVEKYPSIDPDLFHQNMYFSKVYSIESLTEIVTTRVRPLFHTKNIKVLVIDSIAALFRVELGEKEKSNLRAHILHNHSQTLKQLSDEHSVPIVVVNQVTDYFSQGPEKIGSNSTVVPSLGLAWANSINTRIMLSKTNHLYFDPEEKSDKDIKKRKMNEGIGVRCMTIVFSPHLPQSQCFYLIDNSGVHGLQLMEGY